MKTIRLPRSDAMFASAMARWLKGLAAIPLLAGTLLFSAVGQAQVQYQSNHAPGMCLGYSDGKAVLLSCTSSATRLESDGYGMIGARVGDRYRCLESRGKERQLEWSDCVAYNASNWGVQSNGNLRNEQGWCADIARESRSSGAVIQAFDCGTAAHRQ